MVRWELTNVANDYLRFSEKIMNLTQKEYAWLLRVFKTVIDDMDPNELKAFAAELELTPEDLEWGWPGFSYSFEDAGKALWIYSDEYANVENLGAFLHSFMKVTGRKDYIAVTWAETCDKPRIGAFGGGVLLVTAKTYVVESSWSRLGKLIKEHL
ncbi:MAG: hypothetical protein DRP83_00270 [Planctomycetota bacterium]|nr:MAG: hypothetical protein DRP83_00270 [Planctomycetota bacterium]